MRKSVALAVLALSSLAGAANINSANLKGITLCFNELHVQVDSTIKTQSPTLALDIHSMISNKLTAYRIKKATNCSNSIHDLWIQIDGAKNGNDLLIYTVNVDVFNSGVFSNFVSVYNTGYFGSTYETGSIFSKSLTASIGLLIDRLAAEYAKANP